MEPDEEYEDEFSEEPLQDFEHDEEYPENELFIFKTFWDDTSTEIYLLLEDGSFKTIKCAGINEAKTLYLAMKNR